MSTLAPSPPGRVGAVVSRSAADRPSASYWAGFVIVVGALALAPLVLPEFWQRFATEILIWGLLAMSSDILIGYTGMVSFGHSAFFGLGMYGAAASAATTSTKPIQYARLGPSATGRLTRSPTRGAGDGASVLISGWARTGRWDGTAGLGSAPRRTR